MLFYSIFVHFRGKNKWQQNCSSSWSVTLQVHLFIHFCLYENIICMHVQLVSEYTDISVYTEVLLYEKIIFMMERNATLAMKNF